MISRVVILCSGGKSEVSEEDITSVFSVEDGGDMFSETLCFFQTTHVITQENVLFTQIICTS
jgi:hypothetical protein